MRNIKLILLCVLLALLLCSCNAKEDKIQIAATTLPVYEFTEQLCQSTNISVIQLVTEQVSCLHDYSLQVRQMQTMEESDLIVISGAGLEHFLEDALTSAKEIVDASQGITLLCSEHEDAHDDHNGHSHNEDPHIWLSPKNALVMVENITNALIQQYPHYEANFLRNKATLDAQLLELSAYGQQQLSGIQHRELITFHDGFAYFADEFNLTILHTVEEESGSEASAQKLIELIQSIQDYDIAAIFVEKNSESAAASIISAEINTPIFQLDTALSGESYFTAMYHNIDTLKEALK